MLTTKHWLQMIQSVGGDKGVTYVSVPITSGKREFDLMTEFGIRSVEELKQKAPLLIDKRVLQPNLAYSHEVTNRVRETMPNNIVLNPACLNVTGWTQNDYTLLWKELIPAGIAAVPTNASTSA